ncbi:MAG: N-acetyl-gamma-glutamyl-phosphate reductase [Sphingomonadaceae bacterium]|nr:N-acetyl-gamma-glutamyl-phosphate reductase [Sphingomonadaceae bacterium]
MTRVFIDGAAGTTGLEIEARLEGRPEFELFRLDEARRKDAAARRDALNAADTVILCLPDAAAREAVTLIENRRTRVIDASSAHRVATGWTYGFPELGFDVAGAMRVSNPGCYPTGFLALVAPLVKAGLIAADARLGCNAVSGYSGGGKAMIAEFEDGGAPAWRAYALDGTHKHIPEMRQHCGLAHPPLFAPSVANTYRGMIVEVPLGDVDPAAALDALTVAYAGSPVVRVVADNPATVAIERMAGTDRLDLFVFANAEGRQVRLAAALDNLGKGAAGAAVQNLNLMAGLPETTGLRI